jgi:DNA-binding NarL/FixJ family response regulator
VPATIKSPTASRILIVDDHPLFREGVRLYIDRQPDLHVCGECATQEEAHQMVEDTRPELVLVDISLGGTSGIDLVRALRSQYPDLAILVVSMHDESLYAERSVRAGAMGYVMKHDPPRTVIDAIRRVLGGEMHLSPRVAAALISGLSGQPEGRPLPAVESLSDREREVFGLIGRGKGTRQIAEEMKLTVPTINSFRARIKDKLQLKTATELTLRAMQWVQDESGRA